VITHWNLEEQISHLLKVILNITPIEKNPYQPTIKNIYHLSQVGANLQPLEQIRHLSVVLLGITPIENKSIQAINELALPPNVGENIVSSQDQLGFQPIKLFMGESDHLKNIRVS